MMAPKGWDITNKAWRGTLQVLRDELISTDDPAEKEKHLASLHKTKQQHGSPDKHGHRKKPRRRSQSPDPRPSGRSQESQPTSPTESYVPNDSGKELCKQLNRDLTPTTGITFYFSASTQSFTLRHMRMERGMCGVGYSWNGRPSPSPRPTQSPAPTPRGRSFERDKAMTAKPVVAKQAYSDDMSDTDSFANESEPTVWSARPHQVSRLSLSNIRE
eukprot:gnl/TRDRNA2_/TRDRNA2_77272_c0_seq1.p1 gnl/TRDRNA2_/TRDRNA2_77272_c0~~gnl/TRDRNA2_/TRDRNA2_77272_c0_seq1.p1  ORF type:complete len:227 (-),score=3.37 gnl/TRDRNA2_/TRDRNA2_77272_c0_seq1:270-917(-)